MASIRIQTQYLENYSDSLTPHWKQKGGYTFTVNNVDTDTFMYAKNLVEVLTTLCKEQSNEHCKYEYLDHEIDFHGADHSITAEMLDTEIRKEWDDGHALDQVVDEMLKSEIDIPGFEGTLDELDILCDIKTITDDYASKHLNKN